jgi:hypothetical protein
MIPGVAINTTTVSSLASLCITWAENHVKSKLARRYDVSSSPFLTSTTIPPQITSITEQLAGGYLFKQISRGAPESIERGEALIVEAKASLMMLSKSECDLVDTAGSFLPERTDSTRLEVISSASSFHTTFDEDSPLNWKIDGDKVQAIADDRDS